jgi:GTP-binding protein
MPAPVVAIIGRPNVGKSTFFNRVLGERRAVVHDRPGITRDRHTARGEWSGRRFVMIDTGGFLPTASEGRDALVRRQAEAAIGLADAVLFMVDARTGATDLDTAIARSLRRQGTPVLLVVNKVDKAHDPVTHDFHRLGIGVPHPISSENGTGIGDLLDALLAVLPDSGAEEEPALGRIAIVGRPNVGKSSIVNALLHEDRMIVEPRPGTTLDAIDTRWDTAAGTFVLVDTAGIRRQSEFADQAEFYAVVRALQALQRADVAGIVVDATLGFQKQEARLVHEAYDAGCSVLLLYNKWDLVEGREEEWKRLMADRERRFPTLGDLPAAPVSALRGIHLHRLPAQLAARVDEHARRLPTARLNDWLKAAQRQRGVPSTRLGHVPKLYYATQTGRRPPEVTVFVNDPRRLLENYRRFLWLHFVEHFAFRGTPVRMRFRKSE